MFQKILIANRGEIAVRIIRACRDMGIISVAVYSEADKEALHAQIADEAICIGPANPRDSYLNMQNLISAALASGAQAIHPGFGFLSENAEFAQLAIEYGIAFIGPKPQTIRLLGDKSEAKRTAIAAGVPVALGSDGAVANFAEAEQWAEKIGYPVMLKASAGGGGKGIRVAHTHADLKSAYDTASGEAQANFGDGRLYIERYIENPRHIEVQILGDTQGNVVHLFERECSIQRRHQKLIEEAPSFFLDPQTREKICSAARNLAQKVGYVNAGTVEFLVDDQKNFFFCEMNTRIQVEHPVTEQVTGVDLVCEQIKIAAGEPISFRQEDLQLRGHAIECRINAEDPARNFAPCPGHILAMHLSGGPGVRMDTAAYQGYTIPPFYDSMIGKLIVTGKDRAQAIARMRRALAETLFDGVTTSVDFQLRLLSSDIFVSGDFHTNSIANGDFNR
ncbi:MAG: acetyl-CoA carboxylase biotin carboxylase subunit [Butyricicoccus pullicaecorum]|nr:acetyl-CoA carboxylase biotin carboxylase subunit [Butyricicoccus pullicaecorum]MDO4669736.1 acetyl-CoA carboxylase biotin carboxylase subunit [Butyricicoccus pullicaecorum]